MAVKPHSIAIFGASGRIGAPLAAHLRSMAPDVRLHLLSSFDAQAADMRLAFSSDTVAVADYLKLDDVKRAVKNTEAVFVITPHFLNEQRAMENLVLALREARGLKQVVRIVGYQPGSTLAKVPKPLRDFGFGVATQHFIAQEILEASGLPVTYLNLGSSMMDNFLRNSPLRTARKLVWPVRLIPYVDPREVGEAAARIFLATTPADFIQRVHTLNNNYDLRRGHDVAAIMSSVAQMPIDYDGSKESYLAMVSARLERQFGIRGAGEYMWEFFEYERTVEDRWTLDDFLERTLGRKPLTLEGWIHEHRQQLFGHDA